MKFKLCLTAAVAMAAILCIAGVTMGQEKVGVQEWTQVVEQLGDKGKINWTGGYIEAVGIGAPAQRDIGNPRRVPTLSGRPGLSPTGIFSRRPRACVWIRQRQSAILPSIAMSSTPRFRGS